MLFFFNSKAVRNHARKKCHPYHHFDFQFQDSQICSSDTKQPPRTARCWERSVRHTSHAPWLWEADTGTETSPPGMCLHFQQWKAFMTLTATKTQRAKANRDGSSSAGDFLWCSFVVKRPTPIHGFLLWGYFSPRQILNIGGVTSWIMPPKFICWSPDPQCLRMWLSLEQGL